MSGKGKATSASRKAYYMSRKDGKAQAANKTRRLVRHLRSHPRDASAVTALIRVPGTKSAQYDGMLMRARADSEERANRRQARREARRWDALIPRM